MTMDNALAMRQLTVRRDSFTLKDVDLQVPSGYVTGVVGPNGAGKTTLLKTALGLLTPRSGEVTVLGHPAGSKEVQDRIGVVLDRATVAPEWRVGTIGRRIGRLYRRWDEQQYRGFVDRFGIPLRNRVDALSRGQAVKLSIAIALAHNPEILILDEPTSGLDPVSRRDLADVIREFMVDPAHTTVFSTHITSELDDLADRIIVLNAGTVVFDGMLHDLHEKYVMARGPAPLPASARAVAIGARFDSQGGYEALIRIEDTAKFGQDAVIEEASTDDVVIHFAGHSQAKPFLGSEAAA
ncbi:MAG: ABC transporter ATP-binding protein [Lacisediminihabitans sp.]